MGNGISPARGPSEFVIVASEDNTNVAIVPSCTSLSGTPAGSTVNLALNQGETYQYLCGFQTDVTGTEIASDKSIGVIAGNSCAFVPVGLFACDILSEILLPTSLYSTDFFTVPLPNGAAHIIRIMAAADNILVSVDDGVAPTNFVLNRGEIEEFTTGLATHITSDGPILVVKYAVGIDLAVTGDPFEIRHPAP